jgi:hypothetical protein
MAVEDRVDVRSASVHSLVREALRTQQTLLLRAFRELIPILYIRYHEIRIEADMF